ncbi:MAG: geranylgeranyl reductase family protein [Capsulimonadales bacterium]|nr:geranylgeranyl reductase family protein [Capsulimonadales bacterium]
MPIWDVIVVGSGPGGATCAWKAADAGMRVLLLERAATLPRYKPCGGGIPASLAEQIAGFDDPSVFSDLTVTRLRHSWKGKDPVLAEMRTTAGTLAPVWMVKRPQFDHFLTERARAAGADIRTGVRVRDVLPESEAVRVVSTDGETWQARYVVGADGAKGIVGPRVGLRLRRQYGIAREIEIPDEDGEPLYPETAYLDYGTVPNGYAWIFPKTGFLSVGAGMLLPKRPSAKMENRVGHLLKSAIDILMRSVGRTCPDGADAPKLWAHPIPFWTGTEPLATADGRVLLVGDAAGVVQPLFGEGIQYAVRTGALAAAHLAAGTTQEYTGAVAAAFGAEFDAALRVGRVFHRAPYLSYRLGVKNPAGTRLVGRIMAGEASFVHLEQRIYERLKNPLRR